MRSNRYLMAFWIICMAAGSVFGYGIYHLERSDKAPVTEQEEERDSSVTRMPIGEAELHPNETITVTPTAAVLQNALKVTEAPTAAITPTVTPTAAITPIVTPTAAITPIVTPTDVITPTVTPSAAIIPTAAPTATVIPTVTPTVTITSTVPTPEKSETISYPAKIFGQTPRVDRSDSDASYFEFALDLIRLLEPEIEAKNKNATVLFTRFVLRALFCGVDIKSIQINDPIPRRQAALAIYLAAEIIGKSGTDTTAVSAEHYVMDINACSATEKKAIAYLYEQGIEEGYRISGQQFYPEKSLREEDAAAWIQILQQKWN